MFSAVSWTYCLQVIFLSLLHSKQWHGGSINGHCIFLFMEIIPYVFADKRKVQACALLVVNDVVCKQSLALSHSKRKQQFFKSGVGTCSTPLKHLYSVIFLKFFIWSCNQKVYLTISHYYELIGMLCYIENMRQRCHIYLKGSLQYNFIISGISNFKSFSKNVIQAKS